MPYIILDIDASSPERSLEYVDLLLARLERLGADLSEVAVSYTGGRGFHVRIPAGMVGNPVYSSTADAKRIVRRFVGMIAGDRQGAEGSLMDVIDASCFSPNHTIRAIGSVHEDTGRWCVAFTGTELRGTPWWKIEAYSSAGYSPPERLPDPTEVEAVPELTSALYLAAEDVRERAAQAENKGIIAAIESGVEPGEEFAPGYVGRNFAALLLSLNYIQRYGEEEAWERIWEWNKSLSAPLGEHSKDDAGELDYVFTRAKEYDRRQLTSVKQ